MRWSWLIALGVLAGCTRNRTAAVPSVRVTANDIPVTGVAVVGQPLTVTASWGGSCESLSVSNDLHGTWEQGDCNKVSSFDLEITCSLPCRVGGQSADLYSRVSRDVTPLATGKLELTLGYHSPWHHDREKTYTVDVLPPRSLVLRGCSNAKTISLDSVVLATPSTAGTTEPIRCRKDGAGEGALRVMAQVADDRVVALPMTNERLVGPKLLVDWADLRKLFGAPVGEGLYPVRLYVLDKPVDLVIDVRSRYE